MRTCGCAGESRFARSHIDKDTMIIHTSSSDDNSALATVATAHQVDCLLAFRAHNGGIRVYTNMIIHTFSSYDTFRARNRGNCTPSGSLACFIYIYRHLPCEMDGGYYLVVHPRSELLRWRAFLGFLLTEPYIYPDPFARIPFNDRDI
jgi:hypothetical protein